MNGQIGANKAVAGGLAGAVVAILAWGLHQWAHVELPAEIAAAATTIVGTIAVYVTPHSRGA